ncbi:putative IclR family transcriptional regulator [Rhodococcus wratislaviensis NBRC 100605]|uniref:Glycerol operon regulatory protein n=1 Tax=Rhodococcus wratislaviensis NBRC 100605 TaxID=1219028 RepID=X0Q5L1_RHOWR|nr:putative IclR family transcriptional regulator [Rhodococcus wratislaviensis NBRC 100605]
MEQGEGSGRVIQSVQRAFELLEAVAASGDGARLSELADAVGLNRSTAHNLLASLEALGYVEQAGKGTPYRLTSRLARLVRPAVEAEQALRLRMRPVLERVTRQTGETSYLAFVSGEDYLCVEAVQSAEPLRLTVNPGEREPLLGTAIGHALIAADPDLAVRLSTAKVANWSDNETRIADARRNGYALDLEHFHPGVACVAVSLGSSAAIGVAGPSSRLPEPRLAGIAKTVRVTLADI